MAVPTGFTPEEDEARKRAAAGVTGGQPATPGATAPPLYDTWGKKREAELEDPNSDASKAFSVANADAREGRYSNTENAINNRATPTTDYSQADFARALQRSDRGMGMEDRGLQGQAAGMYLDAANGKGTSVAQADFAQALQASARQQNAMAASARGGGLSRAAAQRGAMSNAADMSANSAGAMAALRANEIAQARAGLAGTATNMRGQDISQQSGDLASQTQEANQAQYRSTLDLNNRNANDAASSFYENQRTHLADQNYEGQKFREAAKEAAVSSDQQQQNINNGAAAASEANTQKYASTTANVGEGVGEAIVASDPELKTDIAATGGNASELQSELRKQASPKSEELQPTVLQAPAQASFYGPQAGSTTASAAAPAAPKSSTADDIATGVKIAGTVIGTAAMLFSDPKLKTSKAGDGSVADSFLDALTRSQATFRYKHKSDEPSLQPDGGKYLGVMANTVEKVPQIGHQLVSENAHGKYLEAPATLSAALAALGRLNERTMTLERALAVRAKSSKSKGA